MADTKVQDKVRNLDADDQTTTFRAVVVRLNYVFRDKPNTTFATMKLCSKLSWRDARDLKNIKRVGRFLERPRVGCLLEWQAHPSALHADNKKSQRVRDVARERLGPSSKEILATNSAEAELYAGNRSSTESMGFKHSSRTWVKPCQFGYASTAVLRCPSLAERSRA